eukprot:scaffold5.g941.t1
MYTVKHAVKLRQSASYRQSTGSLLLVGEDLVGEVAATGARFRSVAVMASQPVPPGVEAEQVLALSEPAMRRLTGLETVPPTLAAAEVEAPRLALPARPPPAGYRLLALDRVQDPGNAGTLLRTALALGWDGVVLLPGCADPHSEKCLRASRAAPFKLPVVSVAGVEDWYALLARHQLCALAAVVQPPGSAAAAASGTSASRQPRGGIDSTGGGGQHEGSEPSAAALATLVDVAHGAESRRVCLVLGSEGRGISPEVEELCMHISIPMAGDMESLNVAASGAVLMAHALHLLRVTVATLIPCALYFLVTPHVPESIHAQFSGATSYATISVVVVTLPVLGQSGKRYVERTIGVSSSPAYRAVFAALLGGLGQMLGEMTTYIVAGRLFSITALAVMMTDDTSDIWLPLNHVLGVLGGVCAAALVSSLLLPATASKQVLRQLQESLDAVHGMSTSMWCPFTTSLEALDAASSQSSAEGLEPAGRMLPAAVWRPFVPAPTVKQVLDAARTCVRILWMLQATLEKGFTRSQLLTLQNVHSRHALERLPTLAAGVFAEIAAQLRTALQQQRRPRQREQQADAMGPAEAWVDAPAANAATAAKAGTAASGRGAAEWHSNEGGDQVARCEGGGDKVAGVGDSGDGRRCGVQALSASVRHFMACSRANRSAMISHLQLARSEAVCWAGATLARDDGSHHSSSSRGSSGAAGTPGGVPAAEQAGGQPQHAVGEAGAGIPTWHCLGDTEDDFHARIRWHSMEWLLERLAQEAEALEAAVLRLADALPR